MKFTFYIVKNNVTKKLCYPSDSSLPFYRTLKGANQAISRKHLLWKRYGPVNMDHQNWGPRGDWEILERMVEIEL